MKKLFALLLAVAMVLAMTACGGSSQQSSASPATSGSSEAESSEANSTSEIDYSSIKTAVPGKLTVATSPDFAPYEFYAVEADGTLKLAGFDIALAGAIAEKLGLELDVVPMDFDNILLEVQSGNVDLGISGFSPDPERAEVFDFSDLYYLGGQAFVILESNKDVYTDYETLKGKQVGAQTGSIQMNLAQENCVEGTEVVGLVKVTDIIQELLSGKLQGAFIETAVAECYKINYPELCIAWDVPYEDAAGSAVAIQKGNEDMVEAVNAVIAEILANGTMNDFIAQANELAVGDIFEGQESDYTADASAAA